jgi:hypothetical protein
MHGQMPAEDTLPVSQLDNFLASHNTLVCFFTQNVYLRSAMMIKLCELSVSHTAVHIYGNCRGFPSSAMPFSIVCVAPGASEAQVIELATLTDAHQNQGRDHYFKPVGR